MTKFSVAKSNEVIDAVVEIARERLGKRKAADPIRFIRQFFGNVPYGDLAPRDTHALFGGAVSFWRLAARRATGQTLVRVHNPTLEEHGWTCEHTVVEVVNDDMPFLVDSMAAALTDMDLAAHLIIHPIFNVRRDAQGSRTETLENGNGDDATRESYLYFEVSAQSGEARLREIQDHLSAVLDDVRAAVTDWPAMRTQVMTVIDAMPARPRKGENGALDEAKEFMKWVYDDHFTLLGYRHYAVGKGENGAELGILRDETRPYFAEIQNLKATPKTVRAFINEPDYVIVTKANVRASVHRSVHLDAVIVKTFGPRGRVNGLHVIVGLFTSKAYGLPIRDIPLLRAKVRRCIERSGFDKLSHDGKALAHVLDTLPRDELYQIEDRDLYDLAVGVHHLQERKKVGVFVRKDRFERAVSCLVYIPRTHYTTLLRYRIQTVLEKVFAGIVTQYYTLVDDSPLARLHMILRVKAENIPAYDIEEITTRVVEVTRAWDDVLEETLLASRGEERGQELQRRYQSAFPYGYRERFSAAAAVRDIDMIETTLVADVPGMSLYRPVEAADNELRFKVYHKERPIPLSDILPMLEDMGLKVVDEIPYRVRPSDADVELLLIHDFGLTTGDGLDVDLGAIRQKFQDAFLKSWTGEAECDGFNKLVIRGDLAWRQVVILRAYAKYLQQAGIPFSQTYIETSLFRNPAIAGKIVTMFETLFDPAVDKARESKTKALRKEILGDLEAVVSADDDRILRRYVNLIGSTLRTNFYQPDDKGNIKPYVSFKIDSEKVTELPLPRPWREIFVYSPRMEGVHLRFGAVARGGMRWSDRREDFRTEILGLVKAQQVKNAVIVPVGSKGGFFVKNPPASGGRDAVLAEGIACYKTLISGMLDITDNFGRGNKVVAPRNVVRRDENDPYLVVAADKGTATFSDIANGVAADYDFWLGDGFASGGSNGYDHKAMGITARGAWESVKRHFREMGIDTQTEDFTCIGVGDMAGDVFGNGMVLSRHIKLLAAFNHLHIFIDPAPDPAGSHRERDRLFAAVAGWDQYDTTLISKGGGVFSRSAKTIKLTPQIKAMIGTDEATLTPNALIHALLKSAADLLWFGGIGTYIKAAGESNTEVGDRANDGLRVTAKQVKVKVIGEGANLGVTARGRVELAERGGRLNTDFIDNSAGVDCSDHEVNIKILIDSVVRDGDLTVKQRNKLLEDMTEEVGELVLRDNYMQTLALSLAENDGPAKLDNQVRLMRLLERVAKLDRAVEFLPGDEELAERAAARRGLTRPELSVILSYSKMWLYDAVLESDLADDPYLFDNLVAYFPAALQKRFADQIAAHRLRREIIATDAANMLINRAGLTFVMQIMDETGMAAPDIVRAHYIAHQAFGIDEIWQGVQDLDNKVDAAVQIAILEETNRMLERATLWFLHHVQHPLDLGINVKTYGAGVEDLFANLDKVLGREAMDGWRHRTAKYADKGIPEPLAQRVAALLILVSACDISRIAATRKMKVVTAARFYFAVGPRFDLGWMRAASEQLETGSHWQKLAATVLIDALYRHQSNLTVAVIDGAGREKDPEAAIDKWERRNPAAVDRCRTLIQEVLESDTVDYAMLSVASRQIRSLYENGE